MTSGKSLNKGKKSFLMEIERERQAKRHQTVLREQEKLKNEEMQAMHNVEMREFSLRNNLFLPNNREQEQDYMEQQEPEHDYEFNNGGERERVDTAPSNLERRKSPQFSRKRKTRNEQPIISKQWQQMWKD